MSLLLLRLRLHFRIYSFWLFYSGVVNSFDFILMRSDIDLVLLFLLNYAVRVIIFVSIDIVASIQRLKLFSKLIDF